MDPMSYIYASSESGESPPPPPRVVFGRDELIETIIGLVENLTPLALIGTGGIGKTSIALTVVHDKRVKQRFDENCRFIRCDQFPTSLTHFLRRLSKVIGAGVENPEDLASLRPFLSSKEMLIVLDNAESVLDPQGPDAQDIYAVVEELSQLSNICLCITSRISTVPPDCETLDIPTLSMEAARDAFYRIYKNGERSDLVNNVLERLDFHPLSITLLATVAHHNKWDTDRLTKEWEGQRTGVLQTHHSKSLAATIELSLSSPSFQELGPDARELLGVVAFFPQGVDETNLEWLFPAISNRTRIFDHFCILSLTHRSNGFVTMLAPLRDHLRPKDPKSSPLLCATKEHYIDRLSVGVYPGKPGYEEARWIESEDVNIEHLLDVFTTIDAGSDRVWDVCCYFMEHLHWHKIRPVVLGPKIRGLPDDHPSKPRCLFELSQLLYLAGRFAECKGILIHALELCRKQGDDFHIARTLRGLADVNRLLGRFKEAIRQAKEAAEICERLDDIFERGQCFRSLAGSLYADRQLSAAEEAASQVIELFSDLGDLSLVCQCHRILGGIHHSKGKIEKAIDHFETAFMIAFSFSWYDELFWTQYSLAQVFLGEDKFDDANAYIGGAKSHTGNVPYRLGRAMQVQANIWRRQGRLKEAKSEISCAAQVFENMGAANEMVACRGVLRAVEEEMKELAAVSELDPNLNGEFLETMLLPARQLKLIEQNDTTDGRLSLTYPSADH